MPRRSWLLSIAALAVACAAPTGDGPLASSNDALVVCAGGPIVQGVDVSYYQGSIDWNAAKASGRMFGIARVADGTGFHDPDFAPNYADMKAAGVIRGSYIFFRPEDDPIAQADIVLNAIGPLGEGDLPPMLDVEVTDGVGAGTIVANINAWIAHVKAAIGRRPMVYTAPYFWGSLGAPQVDADLVVANWGPSCPTIPGGWSGWRFWQYADNGSVPGIGGAVDLDEFNGSLSDLQAYARPPNTPPRGYLDGADCTGIRGWAQDPDAPTQAIDVDFYFGGPAGSGAQGMRVLADQHRDDLCGALGSCEHAFDFDVPLGVRDGKPHEVHAYGIDTAGGTNPELAQSPATIQCPAAQPPLTPAAGQKRHVTDPASMTAWGFSYLVDVAPEPDAVVDAYGQGADWSHDPVLVRGDDGSPEVWMIDGEVKRWVTSPDSLAAWHRSFSEVVTWPAAKLASYARAADLPAKPFLMHGTGPAVYVLDAAPPGPPSTGKSDGGISGGTSGGNADQGGAGGCSVHTSAPGGAAPLFAFGLPLLVALRRRRGGSNARP